VACEAIEKARATLRYLPKYSHTCPRLRHELFRASIEQFARSSHSSVRKNVPISGQAMLQYDRNPLLVLENSGTCCHSEERNSFKHCAPRVRGVGIPLSRPWQQLEAGGNREHCAADQRKIRR
jgi:hypothetical protein